MPTEIVVSPGEAAGAAVAVLAKKVASTAKENPKITGLWGTGLLLTLFATGFRVSQEVAATYETDMARADMSDEIRRAARRFTQLDEEYYYSRGWFSCDKQCQRLKVAVEDARRHLEFVQREEAAKMSDVKATVGIFSEFGVAETREQFWSSFAGGQSFAKRQSMWDLLFIGLSSTSRDENTISILLRWLVQLLFNFTIGLVGALIAFAWKLWSLVASYQPDPATAITFAVCALLAATSMVATYLFALYFCAASGVAAVSAAAMAQARIEGDRARDPRYRVQQGYPRQQYRRRYD
ncbi:hypothetical protein CTAYLR_009871 [Chrysophaeum taylorii]|uniref:Transmembrane protein n=1 Tax=Chrysophaeum taylorii TaxID=2483200 RepID=A0AAD7U6K8_9STRA|nr:hypothetical protein CTAYLR_009871 [Chrysophaeum taylorii]